MLCIPTAAMSCDLDYFPHPDSFDPWRFYSPHDDDDNPDPEPFEPGGGRHLEKKKENPTPKNQHGRGTAPRKAIKHTRRHGVALAAAAAALASRPSIPCLPI